MRIVVLHEVNLLPSIALPINKETQMSDVSRPDELVTRIQGVEWWTPDDVDFYYDIKDPLCDIVIDAAEDWARTTGWQMGPSDI
jgi:hypothetical protein